MIDVASLVFPEPLHVGRPAAIGPVRTIIEDTATREARLPRGPGPCWRLAGAERPRPCWFHALLRGGFASISRRARGVGWCAAQLLVPAEDVFADHVAAVDEFHRRAAERRDFLRLSALAGAVP